MLICSTFFNVVDPFDKPGLALNGKRGSACRVRARLQHPQMLLAAKSKPVRTLTEKTPRESAFASPSHAASRELEACTHPHGEALIICLCIYCTNTTNLNNVKLDY